VGQHEIMLTHYRFSISLDFHTYREENPAKYRLRDAVWAVRDVPATTTSGSPGFR